MIVALNILVFRFNFDEDTHNKINQALSFVINKSVEHIMLKAAEQSNNGMSTIVTSSIATENESDADNLARKLDFWSVQIALESHGLTGGSLLSVEMTACLPGFELSNSRTCQSCVEKYYCTGGTNVKEACPAGTFSIAGANSSKSCSQAVFVVIAFLVPLPQEYCNESFKAKFRISVANVARVLAERVVLNSIKSQSRRTSVVSSTVEAEIASDNAEIAAAVFSRLAVPDDLNAQLALQGLPPGSLLSISVTETLQASGQNTLQWIVVGVLMSSLAGIAFVAVRMLRRKESVEERILQRAVTDLLLRLEVKRKNGFLLSSESVMFWQSSRNFIIVQKSHAEAAARLSMFMDFDLNQFDAFCLCLEGDFGGYSANQSFSKKNLMDFRTLQYCRLCEWLMEIGIYLMRPDDIEDPPELREIPINVMYSLPVEKRFRFLVQKVLMARIWEDSRCALFRRLQVVNLPKDTYC